MEVMRSTAAFAVVVVRVFTDGLVEETEVDVSSSSSSVDVDVDSEVEECFVEELIVVVTVVDGALVDETELLKCMELKQSSLN